MLDPHRYLEELQHHARDLRRSGRFRVVLEIHRGVSRRELLDIEDKLQKEQAKPALDLLDLMRPVLAVTSGFRFQWHHLGADPPGHPGVGLAEIDLLLPFKRELELGDDWEQPLPLDRVGEETEVRLSFPDTGPLLELVSLDQELSHPMQLDLPSYLSSLLDRRAILGWQWSHVPAEEPLPQAKVCEEAFALLFPDGRPR